MDGIRYGVLTLGGHEFTRDDLLSKNNGGSIILYQQRFTGPSVKLENYTTDDYVVMFRNGLHMETPNEYNISEDGTVTFNITTSDSDVTDVMIYRCVGVELINYRFTAVPIIIPDFVSTDYVMLFKNGLVMVAEYDYTLNYDTGEINLILEHETGDLYNAMVLRLVANTTTQTSSPDVEINTNGILNISNKSLAKSYYTIDGSDPDENNGLEYNGAVQLSDYCTVKARSMAQGKIPSEIVARQYSMPTANVPTITFKSNKIIITSNIENAEIYYTLNNTTPTNGSKLYTEPITFDMNNTVIVKAVVYAEGYIPSNISELKWIATAQEPMIRINKNEITITTNEKNGEIRYTLNGTRPNKRSMVYSGPFKVNTSTTINAITYVKDEYPSNMVSVTYNG